MPAHLTNIDGRRHLGTGLELSFEPPTARICEAIGRLVGVPLHDAQEVSAALSAQTARLHARAAR
ncbi:MAG: hypothetical protein IRZ16_16965 [Myxococcaceae bacterium]|nr:hypothetical protein [Myxococcaceae bacterium]